MSRVERIRERLQTELQPEHLAIEDQSALHAGHEGAKSGRGHFAVLIVSKAFAGKNPIERHRMIYHALNREMQTEIHALSIKSLTPEEYRTRSY
ncbi:MAG TPA: BolA family protein [Gammaproteobacteria bacterium]